MFGLFSKGKNKANDEFDLEDQPLIASEKEENDEIQTLIGDKPNYPEIEPIGKYETLLTELDFRQRDLNRCIELINAEPKLTSAQKSSIKKVATTTLLSGAWGGGSSYLIHDFVTRCANRSQLEDLWKNLIVSTYNGRGSTCYELNGSLMDPNYSIADECSLHDDIRPGECIQLHNEYCSEAMIYYILPEGIGVAFAGIIFLFLLYLVLCSLYQLMKSCQQDSHSPQIDQCLSHENLYLLKYYAEDHLPIKNSMTKKQLITRLEHCIAEDITFIKYCLELKKHAHYLFYISTKLIEINGIELPYEVAESIFLDATQHINIAGIEKTKQNQEAFEGEKERGWEEIPNNSCETGQYLSKKDKKLKIELFGRFFSRAVVVPNVDYKNQSIIESNILQVFR
ncbi:hypothetical protein OQJ13_14140 [Legionella sp. PATHC035]|uniref:hypothetical protein n=1 Tax=Legionella sp. PATHC035 TaxID=2992040 RepID=UPI0022438825|nr:hypothetical protein [Legionella sp. PATHC035]MCW8410116.1 hypothetical protein [Legionella sp. PATHC035]